MAKSRKSNAGRKPKIDANVEARIIDIVTTGGSLNDAAHIVGINPSTTRRYKAAHPDFARRVLQAQKTGKMKLIERVGTSKAWQAAAWMLERKYGAEYGRRESIKQEVTGKQTIETTIIVTEVGECADEYEEFARRRMGEAVLQDNRN